MERKLVGRRVDAFFCKRCVGQVLQSSARVTEGKNTGNGKFGGDHVAELANLAQGIATETNVEVETFAEAVR